MSIDAEEAIERLVEDLKEISKKGFVRSERSHDTGIGKTLEEHLGVTENNLKAPDYMNLIEVKAKRNMSISMFTMFTKSPSYPRGANGIILDKYGYPDEQFPSLKELHTTISATDFNTVRNGFGFKAEVSRPERRVYVKIKDLKTGKIFDDVIYYTFEDLEKAFKKCKSIAAVGADHKEIDGKEHFHFTDVTIWYLIGIENLINAIERGYVLIDIRLGVFRSGEKYGKLHDHGTGFRINSSDIGKLFRTRELKLS